MLSDVIFYIAAIGALTGAIGVVMLRNPFYNVLALVLHLLCLAGLFLLLRAFFVAAAQVVVYAGAVMVLYVFVVAYVGGGDEPLSTRGAPLRKLTPLFVGCLIAELLIALLGTGLGHLDSHGAKLDPSLSFGSTAQIGTLFLTRFLFVFELASFLLLVSAVGAVMLARRRRGLGEEESGPIGYELQRPLYTGTQAEAVGGPYGGSDPHAVGASVGASRSPVGAGVRDARDREGRPAPEEGGFDVEEGGVIREEGGW